MRHRLALILPTYFVVYVLCYYTAFLLRFEFRFPDSVVEEFSLTLPFVITLKFLGCVLVDEWRRSYRYSAMPDILHGVVGTSIAAALFYLLNSTYFEPRAPRSVIAIDWALTILAIGILRSAYRWYVEMIRPLIAGKNKKWRALIYSPNREGLGILRALQATDNDFRVVGLVQDDSTKNNHALVGDVRVFSSADGWKRIARRTKATHVLIPGSVPGGRVRSLVDECAQADLTTHVIPAVNEIVDGRYKLTIRDVTISDLLRREPARLDMDSIREYVTGRRVLVTGAAGSIGAELCRQILRFGPDSLVLADQSEFGIFSIERELENAGYSPESLEFVIADVSDRPAMHRVMREYRPDLVFHAAAYKHVPLMERNPVEAIRNNVIGTEVVAGLAHEYEVSRFVLISTDKAVRPVSMMGATKLVAEKYVQAVSANSQTQFLIVRFGNVLDSAGSVVPLFRKQIEAGGPVTVTHPEMTRFFMTIPEAVQLVLQAGAVGRSGDVLILEMGEPVRIVDLAKDMISLSGLNYPEDIDIIFTGMRPGERLHEELFYNCEKSEASRKVHDKIHCVRRGLPDPMEVRRDVARLNQIVEAENARSAQPLLQEVVDRYVADADASDSEMKSAA